MKPVFLAKRKKKNFLEKLGQNPLTHSPWSLPRTKGSHVSDEGRDFVTNVAPVVVNQSVKQMNEQINKLINKIINPWSVS